MPIAKGEEWGVRGPLPEGVVDVASDAEARDVLERARLDKRPFPPLRLRGGDLCRTLGGPGDTASGEAVSFPIDLGEVLVDGRLHLFVAHLVARSRLWQTAFVVMNAQWLGAWNLGPRAHPNDGLFDVYESRLGTAQVLKVRSRIHHGAHLPHPGIKERRTAAVQTEFVRPLDLYLDGERVGTARTLSVRCRPDVLRVAIGV